MKPETIIIILGFALAFFVALCLIILYKTNQEIQEMEKRLNQRVNQQNNFIDTQMSQCTNLMKASIKLGNQTLELLKKLE